MAEGLLQGQSLVVQLLEGAGLWVRLPSPVSHLYSLIVAARTSSPLLSNFTVSPYGLPIITVLKTRHLGVQPSEVLGLS